MVTIDKNENQVSVPAQKKSGFVDKNGENSAFPYGEIDPSSLGFTSGFRAYPSYRDHNKALFLSGRSQLEGAEGVYWRVHDQLYDLSQFAQHHPGGRFLIEATRGLDVTELFESCHLSDYASQVLKQHYVKPANEPRNSPYTFHENGFYRTLKRRAVKQLKLTGGTGPTWRSHLLMDGVVVLSLISGVWAAYWNSVPISMLAGVILHLVPNVAHNYIHQRPTWRNYYVGMTQANTINGFRSMHVITHHVFPNTIYDIDVMIMEPLLRSLTTSKSWKNRWLSPIAFLMVVLLGGSPQILMNIVSNAVYGTFFTSWEWMLTLTWWPVYWLASGFDPMVATRVWFIVAHCSFACGFFLLFAGTHRHPDDYHDGDEAREDRDWGLWQLDTANERSEYQHSVFLTGAMFGDHALHHLFPTVDFSRLPHLYALVKDVCSQFNVKVKSYSQLEVMWQLFVQMNRVDQHPKSSHRSE